MSDINVVNQPMLKKALGGTIVGNTMEWYDVGVEYVNVIQDRLANVLRASPVQAPRQLANGHADRIRGGPLRAPATR